MFVVNGFRSLTAVALCAALLIPIIAVLPSAGGAGDEGTIILSEDFDHAWSGTQPNGWERWDHDAGADIDYWCRSKYAAYSGSYSAWCAQIGYNSLYQNAMNKNVTKLEDPDATYRPEDYVLRYDVSMDAFLRHRLVGTDGFSTVTVTFRYWALTGGSTTDLGDDYLWVSVTSSTDESPDSGDRTEVWRQPASNSSGWRTVELAIPAGSTWIGFNFRSGASVPPGGPFIGVFIDDVTVTGTGATGPVSSVGDLPETIGQRSFDVPVVIMSGGSALEFVYLYYRVGGSGGFTVFTTAESPDGRWDGGTVPFQCSRDGRYELFTRAVDSWGGAEAIKTVADAVIVVDTERPSSVANVDGRRGAYDWYATAVEVNLTGWDGLSGVASYLYRLDGGPWSAYDGNLTIAADGRHLFEYYAVDLAGNVEETRSAVIPVDASGPLARFAASDGAVFASGELVLKFEATDAASGVGLVDYSVDGSAFRSLPASSRQLSLSGLEDGAHRVVVRLWDQAGNPTEIALDLKVDHSAAGGDLVSAAAPLAVTALTVAGLVGVIVMARRRS